jgi:hypothetical protein
VKVWRVGMLPLKRGLGDSAFGRAGAGAVIGLGMGGWMGRARRSMKLEVVLRLIVFAVLEISRTCLIE